MRYLLYLFLSFLLAFPEYSFGQNKTVTTVKRSAKYDYFVGRLSYFNMSQSGNGSLSSVELDLGVRHWLSSKAYLFGFVGGYPIQFESGEDNVFGYSLSGGVGLNLDNIIRLEFSLKRNSWGNLIPETMAASGIVVIPIKYWSLREVFLGGTFSGNASGSSPSIIAHLGVGSLW